FSRDWSSDVCSSDLGRLDGIGMKALAFEPVHLRELGHDRLDRAYAHFHRLLDHIVQPLALERCKAVPEIGWGTLGGDLLDHVKRSEERRVGKECSGR